ncbi:hypothetical protein [Acanthopleuribacter pedis]|uniref:Ig-like domain-containing protein n=1 Tax=Acanthopleuribacter pedis TaxID=442870 RepID=A0A8J7QJJ7_9BACT|nr:hypothetical protein [Acanthopleuribacter pedis]MBO1319388.1 hypothetical protein [Acanthopleuribacter pedis]
MMMSIALWFTLMQLDPTFGNEGVLALEFEGYDSRFEAVSVLPDGRILAIGSRTTTEEAAVFVTLRLADGGADTSFADNGLLLLEAEAGDGLEPVAVFQQDTRFLVVVNRGFYALNHQGVLDAQFGEGGFLPLAVPWPVSLNKAVETADGNILVAGGVTRYGADEDAFFARLTSQGVLDPSFGGSGYRVFSLHGNERVSHLALPESGGILFAVDQWQPSRWTFIGRIGADGEPDETHGFAGWLDRPLSGTNIFRDHRPGGFGMDPRTGRYLVGLNGLNGLSSRYLAVFSADGTRDESLDNRIGTGHVPISHIQVQRNGGIWVVRSTLMRLYQSDGTLDPRFGSNGTYYAPVQPRAVHLTEDRRILLPGYADADGRKARLARLTALPCNPLGTVLLSPQDSFCLTVDTRLTVTAAGAESYQWFHNGMVIAGADSAELSLVAEDPHVAGTYRCVVRGDCFDDGVVLETVVTTCSISAVLLAALPAWQGDQPDANLCENGNPSIVDFVAFINRGNACPTAE